MSHNSKRIKKTNEIINTSISLIQNQNDSTAKDVYRVGDWVYCEFESNQPYSIRKIEELAKKPDGEIEAKLRCAFRRCDIPHSLLISLEKRYSQYFNPTTNTTLCSSLSESNSYLPSTQNLNSQQLYQLKHRELFYSRYIEFNVPIDCIRGKVELNFLMSEITTCEDYLQMNQSKFFYQIVYDPNQKLLSIDRLQIRIGSKFQAKIPQLNLNDELRCFESLIFDGIKCFNTLTKTEFTYYLKKITKKKYTNAEKHALISDTTYTDDNILIKALFYLNKYNYDTKKAYASYNFISNSKKKSNHLRETLVNIDVDNCTHPIETCLNSWSDFERSQFQIGIEKFGKNFHQIKHTYLPDKTIQKIVEYYYNVWKKRDTYINERLKKRSSKQLEKINEIYVRHYYYLNSDHSENCNKLINLPIEEDLNTINNRMFCISCQCLKLKHHFNLNLNVGNSNSLGYKESKPSNDNKPLLTSNKIEQLLKKTIDINSQNEASESASSLNSNDSNKNFIKQTILLKTSEQSQIQFEQAEINQKVKSVNNDLLCNECWIYWKKYGAFKYNYFEMNNCERPGPEQRLERINATRNQPFQCLVDNCGKEFKKRTEFSSHSLVTHALVVKKVLKPQPIYAQLHNFHLIPTPLTKASRLLLNINSSNSTSSLSLIRKLARKPVNKLIDFGLIKEEWHKQPRDIRQMLAKRKNSIKRLPFNSFKEDLNDCFNLRKLIQNKNSTFLPFSRPLTPQSQISCDFSESNTRVLIDSDTSFKEGNKQVIHLCSDSNSSTDSLGIEKLVNEPVHASFPSPSPSPTSLDMNVKNTLTEIETFSHEKNKSKGHWLAFSNKQRRLKMEYRRNQRREILLKYRLQRKKQTEYENSNKKEQLSPTPMNKRKCCYNSKNSKFANLKNTKDWEFYSNKLLNKKRSAILGKLALKKLCRSPFQLMKLSSYDKLQDEQSLQL